MKHFPREYTGVITLKGGKKLFFVPEFKDMLGSALLKDGIFDKVLNLPENYYVDFSVEKEPGVWESIYAPKYFTKVDHISTFVECGVSDALGTIEFHVLDIAVK